MHFIGGIRLEPIELGIERSPVETWTELKMLMKERFVLEHYYRDIYYKLMTLMQGSKSLEEYMQELE